jgi:hypothetical protein
MERLNEMPGIGMYGWINTEDQPNPNKGVAL